VRARDERTSLNLQVSKKRAKPASVVIRSGFPNTLQYGHLLSWFRVEPVDMGIEDLVHFRWRITVPQADIMQYSGTGNHQRGNGERTPQWDIERLKPVLHQCEKGDVQIETDLP